MDLFKHQKALSQTLYDMLKKHKIVGDLERFRDGFKSSATIGQIEKMLKNESETTVVIYEFPPSDIFEGFITIRWYNDGDGWEKDFSMQVNLH